MSCRSPAQLLPNGSFPKPFSTGCQCSASQFSALTLDCRNSVQMNKSGENRLRQGANHSEVRPRTAEQVPRALARGCDPVAGCLAPRTRPYARLRGRIPIKEAPALRFGARLARVCNAMWGEFSPFFVSILMKHYTSSAYFTMGYIWT